MINKTRQKLVQINLFFKKIKLTLLKRKSKQMLEPFRTSVGKSIIFQKFSGT